MSNLTRRTTLATLAGGFALIAMPAAALDKARASALIDQVVSDIKSIINSGKSERAMYADFERVFTRYGDVPIISRATLGADSRSASADQLKRFSDAFGGYLARKYGARFREFQGGEITVRAARAVKSFYEVETSVKLRNQAPFSVVFRVSDRSGSDLFFDIVIEGISLGKTERTEIGAMLDRRRGDLDRLIEDLKTAG